MNQNTLQKVHRHGYDTIDATGHTGGEWFVDMDIIDTATDIRARYGWNGNERTINTLVAQMAGTRNPLRDVNGKLVAVANHAPHLCADPACPGNLNRQKLELWGEMREALEYYASEEAKEHGYDNGAFARAVLATLKGGGK